jgi:REP element-mobilizing transposase RayT
MTIIKHERKLNRKRGYDYSTSGAYFVTICVQGQQNLFGEIIAGNMILNEAGKMIKTVWDEIPYYYPNTEIDEFIIMPNHIHGIIVLPAPRGCHQTPYPDPHDTGQPRGAGPTSSPTGTTDPKILSLPEIMQRYKTMTTKRYADGVKQNGWPGFFGKLWQRSYYDRIVRDDNELTRIRQYIKNNPAKWAPRKSHKEDDGYPPDNK